MNMKTQLNLPTILNMYNIYMEMIKNSLSTATYLSSIEIINITT